MACHLCQICHASPKVHGKNISLVKVTREISKWHVARRDRESMNYHGAEVQLLLR